MLKIIALLCLLVITSAVSAKKLQLDITISKDAASSQWSVNYHFSENITAINFEDTPYSFIENDWLSQTSNSVLNLSTLQVNLHNASRHYSLKLKGENDQYISGYYTPFLNFSDGSNALYIEHYLPSKVKSGEAWVDISDITLTLTIDALKSGDLLFSGLNEVKNLQVSLSDAKQYAYIGNLASKAHDRFNLILDPMLPNWIQKAYLKAIPEFYNYYENSTRAKLS